MSSSLVATRLLFELASWPGMMLQYSSKVDSGRVKVLC